MDAIMDALKTISKQSKPVILGMGNELNADDGIGPYIVQKLATEVKFFHLLDVGPLPENFTKKIAGLSPTHVIIIDAAMVEGEPGTTRLIDLDEIDDVIFTTHHIPLSYTVQRIQAMCGAEVIIIGIRPGNMDVGSPMSLRVLEAGDEVVRIFEEMERKLA